jgi:hypothetical protein
MGEVELKPDPRFRLIQDGQPVASAQGPSAFAEISHYAHVYGQDGPVRVEYHDGKRWKPLYSTTPAKP